MAEKESPTTDADQAEIERLNKTVLTQHAPADTFARLINLIGDPDRLRRLQAGVNDLPSLEEVEQRMVSGDIDIEGIRNDLQAFQQSQAALRNTGKPAINNKKPKR